MKTRTVSGLQYATLLFSVVLVYKVMTLPALISEHAGNEAWLSVLMLTAIELFEGLAVVKISLEGGWNSFSKKLPKAVFIVFTVSVIVVTVAKLTVFVSEVISFIVTHLFYDIPPYVAVTLFLLAVLYISLKGDRALGRLAEIAIWFVPVIFVLGLTFGQNALDFGRLLPIGADGARPSFLGLDGAFFWSANLMPLMFLSLKPEALDSRKAEASDSHKQGGKKEAKPTAEKSNNKPHKAIAVGATLSLLVTVAVFVVFTANYGAAAPFMDNAFSRLASFNVVSTEIGSIDWAGLSVWLVMCVLSASVAIHASVTAGEAFNVKRAPTAIAVTLLTGLLVAFVFFNLKTATDFARSWVRYLTLGLALIIPYATLILGGADK